MTLSWQKQEIKRWKLLHAQNKPRAYCRQYDSFPSMTGSITRSDTKRVTFLCLKVAPIVPSTTSLAATSRGYFFHSDTVLLQAVQSANAFCEQLGQTTWTRLTTTPSGVNILTFQCVPR